MGKEKTNKTEKPKRYSLNDAEKQAMDRYQRIYSDLEMQMEGMRRQMDVLTIQIQDRCGIINEKAPDGYWRELSYDLRTHELIVTMKKDPAAVQPTKSN